MKRIRSQNNTRNQSYLLHLFSGTNPCPRRTNKRRKIRRQSRRPVLVKKVHTVHFWKIRLGLSNPVRMSSNIGHRYRLYY